METTTQGQSFEPRPGVAAAWALPGASFLFEGPSPAALRYESPTGAVAYGFNVAEVARQLHPSSAEVLAKNSVGELVASETPSPSMGVPTKLAYKFTLRDSGQALLLVDLTRPVQ